MRLMKRWIIGLHTQQLGVEVDTKLEEVMKQRNGLIVHALEARVIGILPIWALISRIVDSIQGFRFAEDCRSNIICPPYHTFR